MLLQCYSPFLFYFSFLPVDRLRSRVNKLYLPLLRSAIVCHCLSLFSSPASLASTRCPLALVAFCKFFLPHFAFYRSHPYSIFCPAVFVSFVSTLILPLASELSPLKIVASSLGYLTCGTLSCSILPYSYSIFHFQLSLSRR